MAKKTKCIIGSIKYRNASMVKKVPFPVLGGKLLNYIIISKNKLQDFESKYLPYEIGKIGRLEVKYKAWLVSV